MRRFKWGYFCARRLSYRVRLSWELRAYERGCSISGAIPRELRYGNTELDRFQKPCKYGFKPRIKDGETMYSLQYFFFFLN